MAQTRSTFVRRTIGIATACAGLGINGCGATASPQHQSAAIRALQREARPIGRGIRFREPVSGSVPGHCLPRRGQRVGVHVELFAADKVVLIPAGIGVRGPVGHLDGRITRARCYGDLVTLDPSGVAWVRAGSRLTLATLFSAWGQPLSSSRLAAFSATPGQTVRVFVDGRRWRGPPRRVRLTPHAEIVLELGPYVPPHASFTFPSGA
jgi:hypothetical protein